MSHMMRGLTEEFNHLGFTPVTGEGGVKLVKRTVERLRQQMDNKRSDGSSGGGPSSLSSSSSSPQ